MSKTGKIDRFARIQIARAKLQIARSLINAALPEIIGNQPEFSAQYIQIQKAFDDWISKAHQDLIEIERSLNHDQNG